MESKYDFIKRAGDMDFRKNLPDLYEKCIVIEKLFLDGKSQECISLARIQNERVMKYLYKRLMHSDCKRVYDLIKDEQFKEKAGNDTLIKYADRIRMDGNEQTHQNTNANADTAYEAGDVLDKLAYVIEKAAERAALEGKRKNDQIERSLKDQTGNKKMFPAGTAGERFDSLPAVPKLFDSACGFIQYFVCPDDKFALNSLELVDAEVYLYRLLKISGYETVLFIGMKKDNCEIYAYDATSERMFTGSVQNKIRERPLAVGKRKICQYSYAHGQKQQFASEISYVLGNPLSKTAIIMPLAVLGKNECCINEIMDIHAFLQKKGKKENILILTMAESRELQNCFEKVQVQLHPWTEDVRKKEKNGQYEDRIQNSVKELNKRKQIAAVGEYGVDEITNLIFRKILIEKDAVLSGIEKPKIYALAEMLWEHCLQKNKRFECLPYGEMNRGILWQVNMLLDQQLKNELFVNELSGIVSGLKKNCPSYSDRLHPLMVDRVCNVTP